MAFGPHVRLIERDLFFEEEVNRVQDAGFGERRLHSADQRRINIERTVKLVRNGAVLYNLTQCRREEFGVHRNGHCHGRFLGWLEADLLVFLSAYQLLLSDG